MSKQTRNERLQQANDYLAVAYTIALTKLGGSMRVTPEDFATFAKHKLTITQDAKGVLFRLDPKPKRWVGRLLRRV